MYLSICLLAISLNLDALCVGLTYGIRSIRIPWISKLILFLLSCGFSFLAIFCGQWLLLYLPPIAAKWIGASILLLMGAMTILRALFASDTEKKQSTQYREFGFTVRQMSITIRVMKKPETCDMDDSSSIEPKEALYLGVALSIDALAAGIAASINGISHWFLPIIIACFQFAFLSGGRFLGEHFEKKVSLSTKTVNVIAGALLMAIALFRVWF